MNKKIITIIVYIIFSIHLVLLNLKIGNITSSQEKKLVYVLLDLILRIKFPYLNIYTLRASHPPYLQIGLFICRGCLFCLGIIFCSKYIKENWKKGISFGLILPLSIFSLIMSFPIIIATEEYNVIIRFNTNMDFFIISEQLAINSIIILLGIFFINLEKDYSRLPLKFLSGKINIGLGVAGIALVLISPLISPQHIYFNSYYIIAYFNFIIGIYNILLSCKLFKVEQI